MKEIDLIVRKDWGPCMLCEGSWLVFHVYLGVSKEFAQLVGSNPFKCTFLLTLPQKNRIEEKCGGRVTTASVVQSTRTLTRAVV